MSETEVQDTPERDFESAARKEGWVSKDEWEAKGKDPALHKDAKSFVEAGEKILPILKSKVDRLEKELARTKETQTKERKATLEAMKVQSEAYEAKLKTALKDAVTKGDGEAVVDLQDRLADSKEKRKEIDQQLKAPETVELPEFQAFIEENEWYVTDKRMKRTADVIGLEIREENPDMPPAKFFREVAKRMKEEMPEKFNKKPPSPEGSNRGTDGGGSKKGVPKEFRETVNRLAAYIPKEQREAYIKNAIENYSQE